jgi:hypothetical protein
MELTPEQKELVEMAMRVPAKEISTAKQLLEGLLEDPFSAALRSTDYDDEPVTEDDIAALREARAAYQRGETIPHEEILREAIVVDSSWPSLKSAPVDDEELAPEVISSIEEARAEFARGEGISHEEILRELGRTATQASTWGH